jgi:integrase/recombinase XerD
MQKFMKWAVSEKYVSHVEAFEMLLEWDSEKITDVFEDYVEFLENNKCMNIGTPLASPELFFTMNRKIWHSKLVRKGIRKLNRKKGGELPIEDKELEAVYFGTNSLRDRCMISILASLGIRRGALIDPVIRFKHLIPIENCYCVKIYDESDEGYWGVLIPEASRDVDRYKQSRIKSGEIITEDSPLLATSYSRWNRKNDYMTDDNLKEILARLIRDKVKRVKTGNRYDKALSYMFRKRFNTKLKLNNNVNSNVAEKVMAHKRGLDGTYLKPTMEECFVQVKKAFPELTIDPTERQRLEIETKQQKIDELETKTTIINEQEDRIKQLEDNQKRQERFLKLLEKYPQIRD